MPQRILALEIDPHELKATLVETSFRDYRVVGFYQEAVNGSASNLGDQLRHFIEAHQLDANTVLSSLPGDLVTLRTFYLPFRDRKRLDQTVPFELETQVPFGLEEVVIAYHVLQSDKTGSTVLAALVQRRDLEEHLATLSAAGLDPKVVDFTPLVTLNVLHLLGSEVPDTFAYVGGSMRRLEVALFRNRHLVGLRTITVATPVDAVEAEASAAGNGHPAEQPELISELVRDIRWTLLAVNGAPLDEGMPCLVAGPGVQFDQIGQELGAAMDVTVRRINRSTMRNVPVELQGNLSQFVGTLGLALREAAPSDVLGVNFRQGEFAYHRGADEIRRALWRTGSLALLALILFIANTYMGYQQLVYRLDMVNAQIKNVFNQTLPDVKRPNDERRYLQDEIEVAKAKVKMLDSISPPSGTNAIDALHKISMAIPKEFKIDIDEYVMDTEDIKIKAKTDSLETPNAIREAIANTHYFADVQVKDIRSGAEGQVDFRIIVALSKDGGTGATTKP